MFEEKADRFVDDNLDGITIFDEGEFVSNLSSEIYPFREKDKISLLRTIKDKIVYRKDEYGKTCHDPEECRTTNQYNKALVFVDQELLDLGVQVDMPTDFFGSDDRKSTFTTAENQVLNVKIDEILYQLKVMGLGQEIIFNEIEELKCDALRVTRKDLGLMVIGKIVEFGTTEIAKMPQVQELYNLLKDAVKELPPFKL